MVPADVAPRLRVPSLDVETIRDGGRLHSSASAGAGGERVLMVRREAVAAAEAVPDERALLACFLAHVCEADPDVLTGWNRTTPPHVKAARRLGAEAGRIGRYVVTRAGLEPVGEPADRRDRAALPRAAGPRHDCRGAAAALAVRPGP